MDSTAIEMLIETLNGDGLLILSTQTQVNLSRKISSLGCFLQLELLVSRGCRVLRSGPFVKAQQRPLWLAARAQEDCYIERIKVVNFH